MKTLFVNQDELASELRAIIDSYKEGKIKEEEFAKFVSDIIEKNNELIYEDYGDIYRAGIERKLGKKRLSLITRALRKGEER